MHSFVAVHPLRFTACAPRCGCSYWIGYDMLNGRVYDVNNVDLGPYNSSTKPYLHFVDYRNLNYITCAVADGRSAYYQYKWWCVAG
jgi:hypothetical protein